jgi:hypothetical protein
MPKAKDVRAQHVRRGRSVCFQVIIKLVAIFVIQIARFVDAQDDGFEKAIETAKASAE